MICLLSSLVREKTLLHSHFFYVELNTQNIALLTRTGLCFYDGRGLRAFHDSEPAAESSLAEFLQTHPVKTFNMVSHIRYATRGEVKLENVHPFQREVSRSKVLIVYCFVA